MCVALMIVKHCIEQQKTVEGVGQLLGAVTDGRASLLFLKLGEFFPGSVIRILMVSTETEPLAESPRLLGVI